MNRVRVIRIGRAVAESCRIGVGHQAGVLPFFRDNGLDIRTFFGGDFIEGGQYGEDKGHHQHQHHRPERSQNRADRIACTVFENEDEKLHIAIPVRMPVIKEKTGYWVARRPFSR